MSLVLRFGLVAFLARSYSLVDLGTFGLFHAIVTIGTQLLGFELYTYTQREIVTADGERRGELVWSQVRFHLVGYICLVPPAVLAASFFTFSPVALACLAVVLISGHAVSEFVRVLIATSYARAAYVVQFTANALWVIPVLAISVASPDSRDIDLIFVAWAISSAATTAGGWAYLRRRGIVTGVYASGNWSTVRRGLGIARYYFLTAACIRALEYIDRFFLQSAHGESTVGTYTFYSRTASSVFDLIAAGVFSTMFPRMIASFAAGDDEWRAARALLLRRLILSLAVLVPCVIVGAHVLVTLLGRPELRDNMFTFYVLLGSSAATTLGLYPFMLLYAAQRDAPLAWLAVSALAINVVLNALLVPSLGMAGAAIASAVAISALGAGRLLVSRERA